MPKEAWCLTSNYSQWELGIWHLNQHNEILLCLYCRSLYLHNWIQCTQRYFVICSFIFRAFFLYTLCCKKKGNHWTATTPVRWENLKGRNWVHQGMPLPKDGQAANNGTDSKPNILHSLGSSTGSKHFMRGGSSQTAVWLTKLLTKMLLFSNA